MQIRKTMPGDIDSVMQIYADARDFMRENGNPTQWKDSNPPRGLIERDIQDKKSYVCIDEAGKVDKIDEIYESDETGEIGENKKIIAVFYFNVENEPAYESVDGKWLNDEDDIYGVIHRIAKRRGAPKGVGTFCINWCLEQYNSIKIDTHINNVPMRKLLDNLGFIYCGIVRYPDGGERIAFQKIR